LEFPEGLLKRYERSRWKFENVADALVVLWRYFSFIIILEPATRVELGERKSKHRSDIEAETLCNL
jgi:hypothetical protein